jgi:hypothetical protein
MAQTADASGRVTAQPQPSGSLPSWLAEAMAQGIAGDTAAVEKPLWIRLGEDRQVPLHVDPQGGIHGTRLQQGGQSFSTLDQAIQSWYLMDDKRRSTLMEDMYAFGLIDGTNREDQAVGVWSDAVKQSWYYAQAGKDVPPEDMFKRFTNLKAGEQGPNGVRTQTNISYRYMDPAGANALVKSAFRQAVGRDATDAELRSMAGAIIDGYRTNPDKTVSTTDRSGNTTSSTTPGFDAQAYLANQLDANPEAAAHQAASELYPALIQALQSPV